MSNDNKTLADVQPGFTTGHCQHNNRPGGCQLHNLQCGWPNCDRKAVAPSLADVQPGGRVRLGDQAERARFEAFLSGNPLIALSAGTAWQVWQAALSAQHSQPSSLDLEAMLATCVPGGSIVDPQVVADNIRHWFSAQPSPGGRRFHHVSQVTERFGMAVTPEEIGAAIASAPSSRFSAESAATAFSNVKPSPGGQAALDCIGRIEEAIEFRVPHDIYAAVHGELAELKAALAARQPVTMDDALAAGDGTLHGAIDHWQERALRAEAELAARQPEVK